MSETSAGTGVSVVIPVCDGAAGLPRLVAAVLSQSLRVDEILLVDSTCRDSLAPLVRGPVRLLPVEPNAFDHGASRSMAAQAARGEYVVFLTQDVTLEDKDALARLIAPLADPKIAAACGRQLPCPDAGFFAVQLRAYNYPGYSRASILADRERRGLKAAFLSNSFAVWRRRALADIGFFKADLIFGEDMDAAARLLLAGYGLAYAAEACVFHSHNYSLAEDFRRYFDMGVFHARESFLLESFGGPSGAGVRYLRHELAALARERRLRLLPEMVLRNLLKFAGYRLGRHHRLLPAFVARAFSMNRAWWRRRHGGEGKSTCCP